MELTEIKGVGPKTYEHLAKLGIHTVDELIRYYPYRYNVYSPTNILDASEEGTIVITGKVISPAKVSYIKRNFNRLLFSIETCNITTSVVIYNRAFLSTHLKIGKAITLIGKYNRLKNTFTANDIKFYGLTKTEVEPVYHVISGIKGSTLSSVIENALERCQDISEIIPTYIGAQYGFMETKKAIQEIHHPTSLDNLKQAKLKLKYEELFEFMFKMNLMKFKNQIYDDYIIKEVREEHLEAILKTIPFSLTKDQHLAIQEIMEDFRGPKRMNRLILGDVGSGKTIVSFIAILLNLEVGYQSALLSPTEVLARQHYENFTTLFPHIRVALLVGSQKKSEKKEIIEQIKNNEIDVVIGTHALLEENVEFYNIGLVITDEQHRFGVNQRKTLQNKGKYADVLYMSATPIPRTYALTIYGDMDISMIKDKPAGRKEILTFVKTYKDIKSIVKEIEEEIRLHHQVYAVVPLILENEEMDLHDIEKIATLLKENFKEKHAIGILHGQMKPQEKEEVMNSFKEGKLDILISTTVIEVGVDVKNATMMVIFDAERFGLATLHQLRGRVGRNEIQSKCLLVSDKDTPRLHVLEESNDGFYISECDFNMRGSGDLFGIRQSGDMIFKIADIKKDYKILMQCKKDSEKFLNQNIETNFRGYDYYHTIVASLLQND